MLQSCKVGCRYRNQPPKPSCHSTGISRGETKVPSNVISQHQTELNTISYFEERLKKEEKEKEEQKLFLTNLKSIIMNKEDEVSIIIDNLRAMMQNMNI